MPVIRLTLLSLTLTCVLGCNLPDNRDHTRCTPEQERMIDESPARAFLSNAEGTAGEWVPYVVEDGLARVEADIAIGEPAELMGGRAIVTVGRLWRNGVVPYRIHPKLKSSHLIEQAMRSWEEKTAGVIRFVPVTNQKDFIEFVSSKGCWSYVGRRGGRQEVGLSMGCGLSATKHEIGHLLGLWHEQSRSDRDEYIEIKWCNIKEKNLHNFFRRKSIGRDVGPYDYRSIMHYPRGAFSANNRITLKSRTKQSIPSLHPRAISEGDATAIRELYSK